MTDPNRREFLVQSAGALSVFALAPDGLAAPLRRGQAHKVGIIGTGRQGRAIIAELQKIDAVQVAAICDVVPARVTAGIERAPGAEGFANHAAVLERQDIEAVIVATPTHLHREIVVDALAAGRHVYCEAPLAATVEDCQAIVAAAAAARGVCQVGFQGRSNPLYKRTRTLVRAGALRDIVSLYAQYHNKTSWRFPGSTPELERAANWRLEPDVTTGLAGEIGAQQFDVMHWLRGRYPVRVEGAGSIRFHKDGRTVHDTIEARLHWEDGVALAYRASLATTFGGQHEIVHGSNASVRLAWSNGVLFKEAEAPSEGWEVYAHRQQFHNQEGIALVADATRLAAQGRLKEGIGLEHPSLYYALADFVRSFAESAAVACSAEEGMRATTVGILTHRAITEGTSVEIPAFG
jgi:predicted dehydrogenase